MLFFILLFTACSTKKNKWVNRTYHNVTAKFNGYFNGGEAMKEAVATLDKNHEDNYYRILPVYRLGTLEQSKTIVPFADKAIKKASVVVKKHSMMIRNKEYCKYIDDSYMLIGMGHFYKRDYYASLELFGYVAREPVKNYKKDPIEQQANIWLMRSYSELGMFFDARMAIDRVLNNKSIPVSVRPELYIALSDFWLKQNEYEKATESLEEALKYIKRKKHKARPTFILAQLYQKKGDTGKAEKLFESVSRMNPSFEMAFYSRINAARCFDTGSKDSRQIREVLRKMLVDGKNLDYKDQIYYTLGEIDLKEEKEYEAIDHFEQSVKSSTINVNQKGMSHLAIGEIYFSQRKYKLAAAYYDSAYSFIAKDYPEYKKVENKRNSLAELVSKYETIERYDSLLRISMMSEADINKKIDELIAKEEEEKRKQRERDEELARQQELEDLASNMSGAGPSGPGASGNGQWYFYNPSARSFGANEFKKVWGDRKLEDNWRRSNKQTTLPTFNETEIDDPKNPAAKDVTKEKMSPEDSIAAVRARFMKELPMTDSLRAAFKDTILEAYYDLGLIYKEKLGDLKEAVLTYETFLSRYPASSYEPTVYYQIYRISLNIPDAEKAEKYRQLIIGKYPDTEYARIINDPDFFKNQKLSKKEAEDFYAETFRLYMARNYSEALNRCRTATVRYSENELMPKFALLKAMCIGQSRDVPGFRLALQDVMKSYPDDPVKTKAQELLAGLDKAQGIAPPDTVALKPSFSYKPDTTHYFVAMFNDIRYDINEFKNRLSNFNNSALSYSSLQVTNALVGTNHQAVVIREFKNRKEGLDYSLALDNDDDVFIQIDPDVYDLFIISAANYQTMVKGKMVEEYMDFFKKVYQ